MLIDGIRELLTQKEKFSDLHIREGEPTRIRGGNGALALLDWGETETSEFDLFLQSLQGGNPKPIMERLAENGGEMDFAAEISGTRFRCSLALACRPMRVLIMRKIESEVPVLSALGLPDHIIHSMVRRPSGIILMSGATGSGKSTTLAAIIQHLQETTEDHILTIEDPIEYKFTQKYPGSVTQRAVGQDQDTATFASAMRVAMRQDPDVIMCGEIRDEDTAEAALRMAETGHLVLSTVHASNAADTISRLRNMVQRIPAHVFLDSLSRALIGVITQMLVPSSDGSRKHLAYELMTNAGQIRSLIKEDKISQIPNAMRENQRAHGDRSMSDSLRELEAEKKITRETLQFYDIESKR